MKGKFLALKMTIIQHPSQSQNSQASTYQNQDGKVLKFPDLLDGLMNIPQDI